MCEQETVNPISPYDDPNVQARLDEGRQPWDICLMDCPSCGVPGYYNEGFYFTCRSCGAGYYCWIEEEECPIDGRPYIVLGEEYSLADYQSELGPEQIKNSQS